MKKVMCCVMLAILGCLTLQAEEAYMKGAIAELYLSEKDVDVPSGLARARALCVGNTFGPAGYVSNKKFTATLDALDEEQELVVVWKGIIHIEKAGSYEFSMRFASPRHQNWRGIRAGLKLDGKDIIKIAQDMRDDKSKRPRLDVKEVNLTEGYIPIIVYCSLNPYIVKHTPEYCTPIITVNKAGGLDTDEKNISPAEMFHK